MNNNNLIGIAILLGIIGIALFGGVKNGNRVASTGSTGSTSSQTDLSEQVRQAQQQVDQIKQEVVAVKANESRSPYADAVTIQYVNRANDPSQEYVSIRVNDWATTTVPITGWMLASTESGVSLSIPKGSKLYFASSPNAEENIVLTPGTTAYIITGRSPVGVNFQANKCSGYLSRFQTFTPYLGSNCPLPSQEDLSSIPRRTINDACFDYIDSLPGCFVQTQNLPQNWSYECTHFIYDKLNYNSCINTHKNDSNFYLNDWRIYLSRSEPLWKNRRENVVLYDANGKIVSSFKY